MDNRNQLIKTRSIGEKNSEIQSNIQGLEQSRSQLHSSIAEASGERSKLVEEINGFGIFSYLFIGVVLCMFGILIIGFMVGMFSLQVSAGQVIFMSITLSGIYTFRNILKVLKIPELTKQIDSLSQQSDAKYKNTSFKG